MNQVNQVSGRVLSSLEIGLGEVKSEGEGSQTIIDQARTVLKMEAEGILAVAERLSLNSSFDQAIALLAECSGKVVITGIGKSGHIASKLASTFASTGTPAFFVHPAELQHGDFGMLDSKDIVIALSSSGETQEIKQALDPIKRCGIKMIALTGNLQSTLARFSDVALDIAVEREACPLNLAPTTSTTAALAMGDALAIVLMVKKGFQTEDFARSHPGGALGKRLISVKDVMRRGQEMPCVALTASHLEVLQEIDAKKLGLTTVSNDAGQVVGIITDGDLRRLTLRFGSATFSKQAQELMTVNPKTISENSLATEALKLMEQHSIAALLTIDKNQRATGLIDLKDLLHAGII